MDAVADHTVISVRLAVASHLRRLPTRAEIHAARRAAHGLAASGQATILRVRPQHAPGSSNLFLARPGMSKHSKLLEHFAADAARTLDPERFDPTAIAQDLVSSVKLLVAAIEAIPVDELDHTIAGRLVASVDASLLDLRRIRRHLKEQ